MTSDEFAAAVNRLHRLYPLAGELEQTATGYSFLRYPDGPRVYVTLENDKPIARYGYVNADRERVMAVGTFSTVSGWSMSERKETRRRCRNYSPKDDIYLYLGKDVI